MASAGGVLKPFEGMAWPAAAAGGSAANMTSDVLDAFAGQEINGRETLKKGLIGGISMMPMRAAVPTGVAGTILGGLAGQEAEAAGLPAEDEKRRQALKNKASNTRGGLKPKTAC